MGHLCWACFEHALPHSDEASHASVHGHGCTQTSALILWTLQVYAVVDRMVHARMFHRPESCPGSVRQTE